MPHSVPPDHNHIAVETLIQLRPQLPPDLEVRTDTVLKRSDADAGIPHYWIIDPGVPVSLLACHLAGPFGYRDAGPVTGTFAVTEPFPVTLDLDALR